MAYYGIGGPDSTFTKGVAARDMQKGSESPLDSGFIELHQWAWHDSLPMLCWISREDSLEKVDRAMRLFYSNDLEESKLVVDSTWS